MLVDGLERNYQAIIQLAIKHEKFHIIYSVNLN